MIAPNTSKHYYPGLPNDNLNSPNLSSCISHLHPLTPLKRKNPSAIYTPPTLVQRTYGLLHTPTPLKRKIRTIRVQPHVRATCPGRLGRAVRAVRVGLFGLHVRAVRATCPGCPVTCPGHMSGPSGNVSGPGHVSGPSGHMSGLFGPRVRAVRWPSGPHVRAVRAKVRQVGGCNNDPFLGGPQ